MGRKQMREDKADVAVESKEKDAQSPDDESFDDFSDDAKDEGKDDDVQKLAKDLEKVKAEAEAKVAETDQILATDKADATEKAAQSPDDESFDDFSDDDTKDEANDNDVQKLANDMEKEKAKVAETDKILATDKADATVESKEKDAAAVKIQSAARGSQARTEKKRKDAAEKK